MNSVMSIQFITTIETLRKSFEGAGIPESLFSPFQALVKAIVEAASKKPVSVYLFSSDEDREVRDYFAHALAIVLMEQIPSAVLVDCDFLNIGMSGVIPDKDGLGFLDFLLYGSSLGAVTQEGPGGVRVIGAGSFPLSKKMPFSGEAFEEASRRLASQSRLAVFCGAAEDDEGNIHPIVEMADVPLLVRFSGRFPESQIDPLEERVAKRSESRLLSARISPGGAVPEREEVAVDLEGAGVATGAEEGLGGAEPEKETVPRAPEEGAEMPGEAEFVGFPFEEKRGSSLFPKILTGAIGIFLIVFLFWWLFLTKHVREPGGGEERAAQQVPAATEEPGGFPAVTPEDTARVSLGSAGEAPSEERPGEAGAPVSDRESAGGDVSGEIAQEPGTVSEEEPSPDQVSQREGAGETVPGEIRVLEDLGDLGGTYVIHVSSFRDLSRAQEDAAYFARENYSVRIVHVDLGVKGRWYRVYIGPVQTRGEAIELKVKLGELRRVTFARITRVPG